MISIISGTNRKSSNSLIFSNTIQDIIQQKNSESRVLNLLDLPHNFTFENEVFGFEDALVNDVADHYISEADKFIFVIPEYNGSFPGVLKAFLDAFMPSRIKGKKALIFGISSGRSGNIRGLDHFTGVLNYLEVQVQPTKLAFNNCHQLVNLESKRVNDSATIELIDAELTKFLSI